MALALKPPASAVVTMANAAPSNDRSIAGTGAAAAAAAGGGSSPGPAQSAAALAAAATQPTSKDANDKSVMLRRFVFGAQSDAKDSVVALDESTVAWSGGRYIVFYNTQYATQDFIACSEQCDHITALAVTNNRRSLAVAESGDVPAIAIYEPQTKKRKRFLTLPAGTELGSREYVAMGFSADGRYLVAQGGFPDWNTVLWSVERGRHLAIIAASDRTNPSQDRRIINQCSISPKDPAVVCVSGKGIFKLFRYGNGEFFQLPWQLGRGESINCLAHVWLPPEDRIICSTDNGDLLLVENGEYMHQLPLSPSDSLSIDTLIAYSKGFICGGDMGLVTVFEKTDDKELYRKLRTIKVNPDRAAVGGGGGAGGGSSLTSAPTSAAMASDSGFSNDDSLKIVAFSLTVPPAEEILTLLTNTKQVMQLNLANADLSGSDDRIVEHVCQPFHSGPVTGIDVCTRKPLIATCGRDGRVFLWNHVTNTVEAMKKFPSEALSIAIHPSGLHLIVGFPDKLRFMNVYGDDIREFKGFNIRSCTECRFSRGGQFFAAAQSTYVHVYFTYTCEQLGPLRGHNAKIKSIYFGPPDDNRIYTASIDGSVMEFSLATFLKTKEHSMRSSISYHDVTTSNNTAWVCGSDRKLRLLDKAHLAHIADIDLGERSATCMAQSANAASNLDLLFVGGEDGTLRVVDTLLAEKLIQDRAQAEKSGDAAKEVAIRERYHEMFVDRSMAHVGPITRMAMAPDEAFVVTGGEDGVVTLWDVLSGRRESRKEVAYAEEILIEKKELEERTNAIAELRAKVAELRQKMENQAYKRELKHEERVQELRDKYQSNRQKQNQLLERIVGEKNEQNIRFTDHFAELDTRQRQELARIEQDYNAKIKALEERSKRLLHAVEDSRAEFEMKKAAKELESKQSQLEQQESHKRQEKDAQERIAELRELKERGERDHEEICQLMEEDTEQQLLELKERFEQRYSSEKQVSAGLKSEHSSMTQKATAIDADLSAKQADIDEKRSHIALQYSRIDELKKEIAAYQHELSERAQTIADKEKKISDLKKKNEELSKFRFVLDYKIKELQGQIDPRQNEIRECQEKNSEMKTEAEKYVLSNGDLLLAIRGYRLKLDGHKAEAAQLQAHIDEARHFQQRLFTDITDVTLEQDPKLLKDKTRTLYAKYIASVEGKSAQQIAATANNLASGGGSTTALLAPPRKPAGAAPVAHGPHREYMRGRDYLERTKGSLVSKMQNDATTSRVDRARIVGEQVLLIRQINELRREVRTLRALAQRKTAAMVSASEQLAEDVSRQRGEMAWLRARVEQLERVHHAATRPVSLPPQMM